MLSASYAIVALIVTAFVTLCIAGWAIFIAAQARRYANDCAIWIQSENADSVSLAKMAKLEVQMLDVVDAHDRTQKSIRGLRSRIGMTEKREREANPVESEAPTGKAALRLLAKERGFKL